MTDTSVAVAQNQKNLEKETEEQKQYRITQKFEDWVTAFCDKKADTYGNATRSALVAYNLDPKTQYGSAARIGHENVQKHKALASIYLESKGITYGTMLDIQVSRSLDVKNPMQKQWFDDLKVDMGYRLPPGAKVLIQNNNNNNVNNLDLNGQEVQDFNRNFEKFLESQTVDAK